jgi:hypothetical protein
MQPKPAIFALSGACMARGTGSSNPSPSSRESANHRFLSCSVHRSTAEEAASHVALGAVAFALSNRGRCCPERCPPTLGAIRGTESTSAPRLPSLPSAQEIGQSLPFHVVKGMVFDTLFALDSNFKPHPQMVGDYSISADKLRYRFILRDGLKFHDGQPVRGIDCVASLKRWMARDALGQTLASQIDEMTGADDKDFMIRLKAPFPLVIDAIAKVSSLAPAASRRFNPAQIRPAARQPNSCRNTALTGQPIVLAKPAIRVIPVMDCEPRGHRARLRQQRPGHRDPCSMSTLTDGLPGGGVLGEAVVDVWACVNAGRQSGAAIIISWKMRQ